MALFMDVHNHVEGLTAEAVSGAHQRDLEVQAQYGVDYKQYWFDEGSRQGVLPRRGAATPRRRPRVHREAHGLVADEITPVHQGS